MWNHGAEIKAEAPAGSIFLAAPSRVSFWSGSGSCFFLSLLRLQGAKNTRLLAALSPALQKNVKNQTIENAVISGKSEKEPNQYPFGTTYDAIYNDLKTQEHIKHDKYIHIYIYAGMFFLFFFVSVMGNLTNTHLVFVNLIIYLEIH